MTMISARRPYSPPKIGGQYNAAEVRQALALLAQAISPMTTRTVIAATTVQVTDDLLVVDTTSGNISVTLPVVNQVQFLKVSIINIGTHTATLVGTVSGVVNPTLIQWQSLTVQTEGTVWMALGGMESMSAWGTQGKMLALTRGWAL